MKYKVFGILVAIIGFVGVIAGCLLIDLTELKFTGVLSVLCSMLMMLVSIDLAVKADY